MSDSGWGDYPFWFRIVLIIMAIIGVLIVIYTEITGELP